MTHLLKTADEASLKKQNAQAHHLGVAVLKIYLSFLFLFLFASFFN